LRRSIKRSNRQSGAIPPPRRHIGTNASNLIAGGLQAAPTALALEPVREH
jgi:hypothetical protein